MTKDDHSEPPNWVVAIVYTLAVATGDSVTLLVWMVVFAVPPLRAAVGGLS